MPQPDCRVSIARQSEWDTGDKEDGTLVSRLM
jgi:hypothetical protein